MFKFKGWFDGRRSKNVHSLDHLKYLHNVLSKNQTVSESNRGLLVETLRSIAEILIWGDQNDSSVFDFFLEKNMLSFFLKILKQKCGSYVCVQLLQTLNILFENIQNETSLYYLLSNNHVNSIIVHKFDFSDEEVMAYYISFLKTLSLKLNSHTIHFFYNDHTNDFPLYTEAIKFFKHSESMVRIAVRTLSLNVYKVQDNSMLKFIRDKTAAPYFSNLVWFIGSHVLELDNCVRNDADHSSQNRLSDLVAEHLDHLHYLNDILCLNIDQLNDVLVEHLLNKLYIPLYIYSLLPLETSQDGKPKVSSVVSLFLLSQVFIITKQEALVNELAHVILKSTRRDWNTGSYVSQLRQDFVAPSLTLEESLDCPEDPALDENKTDILKPVDDLNITDEEKGQKLAQETQILFLEVVVNSLDCNENDYAALFALCLLYSLSHNDGIEPILLDGLLIPSTTEPKYNIWIVEKLIDIISLSAQPATKVRLATLELSVLLLSRLVMPDGKCLLTDDHFAAIVEAKEESLSHLRNYYKKEEFIFGEMFESEDELVRKKPLNVEWLMMDSNILLPPTGSPMIGIEFSKRLPCGEVERARKAIRSFLLIRTLCMNLFGESEIFLPLTNRNDLVQNDTVLDLNNTDVLSCHVIGSDGVRNHRFLVIQANQISLVVPIPGQLGYGRVKLSAMLSDLEFINDKLDQRSLYITIKHTTIGPMFNTKFIFDDAIRCLSAQQRLSRGLFKVKDEKLKLMEKILDIPPSDSPRTNLLHHLRHRTHFGKLHKPFPGYVTAQQSPKKNESRSRDNSPKPRPRSEEIQLESINISKRGSISSTVIEESISQEINDLPGPSGETSFIESSVASEIRKKGQVETI